MSRPLGWRGYSSEDVVRVVLAFLDKNIELNQAIISKEDVVTDGGRDISESLRGRIAAYSSVKYFIEKGLKDD